ncbi:MAG: hypothetical protein F4Y86_04235 [Gammaproteobacteria bacterium]|nr:hypothetical protein [Gammaproteobacteria bacterium]MYB37108.1 hypothetical protein [Gammaproteobacteria bacterium]
MEWRRKNAFAVASYAAGVAMVVAALTRDDLGSAAWILLAAVAFFLIPPLPRRKAISKRR